MGVKLSRKFQTVRVFSTPFKIYRIILIVNTWDLRLRYYKYLYLFSLSIINFLEYSKSTSWPLLTIIFKQLLPSRFEFLNDFG